MGEHGTWGTEEDMHGRGGEGEHGGHGGTWGTEGVVGGHKKECVDTGGCGGEGGHGGMWGTEGDRGTQGGMWRHRGTWGVKVDMGDMGECERQRGTGGHKEECEGTEGDVGGEGGHGGQRGMGDRGGGSRNVWTGALVCPWQGNCCGQRVPPAPRSGQRQPSVCRTQRRTQLGRKARPSPFQPTGLWWGEASVTAHVHTSMGPRWVL